MSLTINDLINQGIVTEQQVSDLVKQDKKYILDIIVDNQGMYELLVNKNILFKDFIALIKPQHVELLRNPEMLKLVEGKKINLECLIKNINYVSKILDKPEIFNLLKDGKIVVEQIADFDYSRRELLDKPAILNLLQHEIITFDQLAYLDYLLVDVLEQAEVVELLSSGKLNLAQIAALNKEQLVALKKPEILHLLQSQAIDFFHIANLTQSQLQFIRDPNAADLLNGNINNFAAVLRLNDTQLAAIDPIVVVLLIHDKIRLDDLLALNHQQIAALKEQEIIKLLIANKIDSGQVNLAQFNSYQVTALLDQMAANYCRGDNGLIDINLLLQINNESQLEIGKEAHIQALLKDGVITVAQLLSIQDRRLYKTLINPMTAKLLREKTVTFADIVQQNTHNIPYSVITLNELLELCSGGRPDEQIPLWFDNILADLGIKIFVTDAELSLNHASILRQGLKDTANDLNENFLQARAAFDSECTIVALNSDNKLLGYAVLDFGADEVLLKYLASASKSSILTNRDKKNTIELAEEARAFSYIGSVLFAAATMACVNNQDHGKILTWVADRDAVSFYDKFIKYGVKSAGYFYSTKAINSVSQIIPGRDFFSRLPINRLLQMDEHKKPLPLQILTDSRDIREIRSRKMQGIAAVDSEFLVHNQDKPLVDAMDQIVTNAQALQAKKTAFEVLRQCFEEKKKTLSGSKMDSGGVDNQGSNNGVKFE